MDVADSILNEHFKTLGEVKHIVLSTCAGNRVTARTVSCACFGEEVLFLSWGHHTKCKQIRENPNIALCHANLQLEGRALILGNPLEPVNKASADKFREKQPLIFEQFSKIPGMQLVKVTLTSLMSWTQDNKGHRIDHFDFEKREFKSVRPWEEYTW
jgi:hypothetical protein